MSYVDTPSGLGALDPDSYANGDPKTFGLPLDEFDRLRQNHPVYLQEFSDPHVIDRVWVLSRHEDVFTVDRDPETWAADRGFINIWRIEVLSGERGKPGLISMDGQLHRSRRGIVSRAFTPRRVEALEARFREYARDIVSAALDKDGPVDFVPAIAQAMPLLALGDVLGIPNEDRERFFNYVKIFSAPFDQRLAPSPEFAETAAHELAAYTLELAERRRSEPGPDVISTIVQAGGDERLSDDDMLGIVINLAAGAADSTANALCHGLQALLLEPEKMAWMRDHADDIPATAIQEILRISSPFVHLVRTATRDTRLHEQDIAEGECVAMMFAAANFDPEAFVDPRTFDPTRSPNPHVTFGRGPHACLGKHVATLEIKLLLEEILQRTSSIRSAGDISYVRDEFARGVYSLPVELQRA